jgi:hypothetical protein
MPCLPPDTAQVERRNWAKKRASTHTRIYKSHPGPSFPTPTWAGFFFLNNSRRSTRGFQNLCGALSRADKKMTFGIAHVVARQIFERFFLSALRKEC